MGLRSGVFASFAFSVVLATTSHLAFAADPPPQDIAQARELGHQAEAAYDAGQYAEAEKLWTGAANLYPAAPTLTLGLARTQAKLGKLVLAQESYNKIIREQGQNPSASPAFKAALKAANAEVGAVSAKIAAVVITVEGPTSPNVTVDDQPVAAAGLGLKRPIDPGSHAVHVEAAGYKPADTTFQVSESGTTEVKLTPEPLPVAPPPPPPTVMSTPPAPPPAVTPETRANHTPAFVAFGVGAAGLVVGGVAGVLAIGKHSNLKDECPSGPCPSTARDDVNSYNALGTISTVGFIVGGVGVAAGAILWFAAPKETVTTARAKGPVVAWKPYLTPSGGGVTGQF